MKIFLDDYRNPAPDMKNFNVVRTYKRCIQLIELFAEELEFLDLDYDLGTEKTGLDVLEFMQKKNIAPTQINIHSDHEIGVMQMRKYAETHFPETKVSCVRVAQ